MTMAQKPGTVVQGTLDMLILKTVALQPMHGYGVGLCRLAVSRFAPTGAARLDPRRVARLGE